MVLDSDHGTKLLPKTVEDLTQRFRDKTVKQGRIQKEGGFGNFWRSSQKFKETAGNFTYSC